MSIQHLLALAGADLCSSRSAFNPPPNILRFGTGRELLDLLAIRNGFYAFESALHVFPLCDTNESLDLLRWNSEELWRFEYGDMITDLLFFAEDVFGGQFALAPDGVVQFDPETAEVEWLSNSLDNWAFKLLDEYAVRTGYPLAHEWQELHGPLADGKRLIPKTPFVAGGDFAISNLFAGDAVEAMRFRGYLAQQIRDLPEGATISLEFE